jgi:rod shape-determining protein MreC
MRNLFSFIANYFNIILFVILEIIAGIFIVGESSFHQSAYSNSANNVVGQVMTYYCNVHDYINLPAKCDSLAKENAFLKNHQLSAYLTAKDSVFFKEDSLKRKAFKFISAKVISNSILNLNNYILLDKGSRNGIRNNMGVVGPNGVVGVVKDVGDNFCSVISFLHSKSKVSVQVSKSNFVSMVWKGINPAFAEIDDIAKHVPIKKGDTVYTSNETWFYPAHMMVGKVEQFELNAGNNFYQLKVKLSTDFSNLNYVYVVDPLLRNETDSLTAKLKDE